MWKPNLTKGGEQAQMLPELLLEESEEGRIASLWEKGLLFSSSWSAVLLSRFWTLARSAHSQGLRTPFINLSLICWKRQCTHPVIAPCPVTVRMTWKGPELFYLQVVTSSSWSVSVVFGFCGPAVFTRTVWVNNVNRMWHFLWLLWRGKSVIESFRVNCRIQRRCSSHWLLFSLPCSSSWEQALCSLWCQQDIKLKSLRPLGR